MAIFNSYVKLPEGNYCYRRCESIYGMTIVFTIGHYCQRCIAICSYSCVYLHACISIFLYIIDKYQSVTWDNGYSMGLWRYNRDITGCDRMTSEFIVAMRFALRGLDG